MGFLDSFKGMWKRRDEPISKHIERAPWKNIPAYPNEKTEPIPKRIDRALGSVNKKVEAAGAWGYQKYRRVRVRNDEEKIGTSGVSYKNYWGEEGQKRRSKAVGQVASRIGKLAFKERFAKPVQSPENWLIGGFHSDHDFSTAPIAQMPRFTRPRWLD